MNELLRRIRFLLRRNRFDQELASDLEFHREMASRQGRANLGNALHLREQAREAWGWTWIDRFLQDLRFAARMLRKSPGFTLAAILMLAIGIGVNVAAFGFFDLMVLRPLNVKDPGTLLRFHRRGLTNYAFALPYPEMELFREHSRTLSSVIALNQTRISMEGEEKQLNVQFVTSNLFAELGANPSLGRLLDPAVDEATGAARVVVLSYGFWQRRFGADPLAVGRTVRLNGKPATIIGVAPKQFSGLSMNEPKLWAPILQQPYFAEGSRLLTEFSGAGVQMFGRLGPGSSPAASEEELAALAAQFRPQHPGDIWEKERLLSQPAGYATTLSIGNRSGTGPEERNEMLPVFALAVTLLLLILVIACGNLGSLLLARGVAREREIAIRVAVGAGRGRLVRQLFTESLLLAVGGSAAGLAMGYAVLRGMLVLSGGPTWMDPAPDWRIVAFSLAMGLASALLFGLAPALQVARQRHRAAIFRQFLVGAQVAASCVLLIVAGLLGRALNRAASANPGFDYRHTLAINPGLSQNGYTPAKARAYLDNLEGRLRALPGVDSVSLALAPPLGHVTISTGFEVKGRSLTGVLNRVDPEFFQTMRIPLLRGRNFTRNDARVAIVGESLARAMWPGEDPLGKTIAAGSEYTVVGVSGTAKMVRPQDSDSVEVYLPVEPADLPALYVMVSTAAKPEDTAKSVLSLTRSLDPTVFAEVQLLTTAFQQKLQTAEYSALAVTLFGSAAHLLACLGILGVVAYGVSQRTREIGIRMALGARPWHVLSVVLRQFSFPVIAGLLVGTAAAAALSRFLRGLLFGVDNLDPAAYLTAIGIFLVTVAGSALWPARRALRIDPIRALRCD